MTLVVVGWCFMVTGQSVVLYSRLHIVMRNTSRLRLVLAMIVANAVIGHIPTAVFAYGSNSSNPAPFIVPYSIYERVQVTLFFLQEIIISGLYIHETVLLMRVRSRSGISGRNQGRDSTRRRLMTHLVVVNAVIVVLDITILALEFAGLYAIQTAYKGFVYSIKLKIEFSILNRLVEMTQGGSSGHDSSYARTAANNNTSLPLETMDGLREKNRRSRAAADHHYPHQHRNDMGNKVYVGAGGPGADAEDGKHNGVSVVMTTEVTVQRDRLYVDSDRDRDAESISGRSGATVESAVEGSIGQARQPSYSSQRNIVNTQY
ncbi:hypothetical protein MYCTH_2311483 [Thermothelomyces thermophilus ATCC 42464]|uniref:DUF7703 domain-containing protein n=1 Tax=Thermothelomyces thermophilus (strain ATCC 42464 / BCRC 31852 / DSM 1799) TaxID=573729 RepID=G2QP70_THET4|nr:uncharacterized protein MYCTH_2311483 [Thermothelomyces thermophilus ATCC 42464]AEO61383.1 hypothetical protein MYCTH_2311483 [Thermothelomyces thermophilus ATCC 42464]